MKKENKCPLKPSEWIIALTSDQNQAHNLYYSTEMSIFTKTIIVLTLSSIVFMLISILNTYDYVSDDIKKVIFLIGCGYLVIILVIFRRYFNRLSEIRKKFENIIQEEDLIIEDIIDGELVNSNEIRDKYKKIK